MTAENLAKFRLDPNIDFWKELKNGSDHFEVTKAEPPVLVCGKHYVFGAAASGEVSAATPCPALKRDDGVEAEVADKAAKDDAKVAELVASGVKPIRLVYQDGGQNPAFAGYKDSSDPDALAAGPEEIVLDQPAKAVPAAVKVASADAAKRRAAVMASAETPAAPTSSTPTPVAQPEAAGRGRLCGLRASRRRFRRPVGRRAEREEMAASRRRREIPKQTRPLMCRTSRRLPARLCPRAATRRSPKAKNPCA